MAYTDIFETVKAPDKIPRYPNELLKYGTKVIDLAREAEGRKANKLKFKARPAIGFPLVSWQRVIAGKEVSLDLIDKRKARAGLLLTAHAETDTPGLTVVKAFAVNDRMPCDGLKRFVNQGFPSDSVGNVLEGLHQSEVALPLNRAPDFPQRRDYARAIATIYY